MKNSQLYKGSLTTIIMKLLGENGRMYGYEITQKVKEITKGELNITEGALYPALHKLEAEGLLDVEIEKVDNRLRKYYKLTENGQTETVNRLAELEEFINKWEGFFFNSYFSHLMHGHNPINGNCVSLWENLIATGDAFPMEVLTEHNLTLKDILR